MTRQKIFQPLFTLILTGSLLACGGGGGGSGGSTDSGTGTSNNSSSSNSSSSSSSTSSSTSSSSSSGGDGTVTISGQVSGIDKGQLNISNAGNDDKQLNSDSEFSFTVPEGGSYQIRVDANPLEQLCRVENGSASNANANIDNVNIICTPVAEATDCEGNIDSDGDTLSDCEELNIHFTNPWVADTDGDGFSDGREAVDFDPNNNRYIFNPRVADMAVISVDLTAVPEIDLDFTESSGSSRSVQTSYEQSESQSISRDWGGEISRQLEIGHTLSVETTHTVGTEVNVSLTDIGASASYEASLSVGFENSVTQTRGSSVNWSNSATAENTRAYGETLDLTEEQNSTYNGGFLRVTARIRNDGHIPYDLENLTLSAVLFDPLRPFNIESIGTMEFSGGGFPPTTILSGESAPLNFSTSLTLGKAQRLLRDSENIVVMPGTYRLLDIDDQSILLVDRDVSARTATVIIDYGIHAAREDKHRVAVNRGNGQRSITIAEALADILNLDISEGTGEWIYRNDSAAKPTYSGLLGIGEYKLNTSNNQYWLIAHNRNNDAGAGERVTDYYNLLQEGYNLADIVLRAGDKLTLVYVGDKDRDSISDRMETQLGTDDELLDTDGDGLGDGLEFYGWLTNLDAPPCGEGDSLTRVYSSPLSADSDNDGMDDDAEKASCLNPSFDFVADAGSDQTVDTGTSVTLFASTDGFAQSQATFSWTLLHGPDVRNASGELTRELAGRQPTFAAPGEVSTLIWQLQATIAGETQTDTTVVQVQKDRSLAVYVGKPAASGTADGSREAPYGSLSEALSSIFPGDDLYIMTRDDPYTLVNTLEVPDGTSLFGGYDSSWVRDVKVNRTPIALTTNLAIPAVRFSEISQAMWFSGFAVRADGTGGSTSNDVVAIEVSANPATSHALYITDNRIESSDVASGTSSNPGSSYAVRISGLSTLRLFNNSLIAGAGGLGDAGSPGSRGADGGDASGRTRGAGGSGANGGTGGDWGRGPAGGGGDGADGGDISASVQGGAGGNGAGACANATDTGNRGDHGGNGSAGAGGTQNYISLTNYYLAPKAGDGTNGGHAAGGGGGAGGGGCSTAGGGVGGGGGEGGSGGTRGFGGAGGGASIGLWLNAVTTAELRNNTIQSNNGGLGGNGGSGGQGGWGGEGAGGGAPGENCIWTPFGDACDRGGAGAAGGDGGNGGRGGDGGGGAGGPSFGLFVTADVAPLLFDNTITAGDAGNGGYSRTNGGRGGDSYAIYDVDITDGALPEIGSGNTLTAGLPGTGGSTSVGTSGSAGGSGQTNF